MKMNGYSLAMMIGSVVLAGCTSAPPQSSGSPIAQDVTYVGGVITYRESIGLQPGSTAKVTLYDMSIADAPSAVIAQQTIDINGQQVPIVFDLKVLHEKLVARHRYSIRGTITGPDGQLMWTTNRARVVNLTRGNQDVGRLEMVRVARRH
jgi:putative lipoprotein